MSTLLNLDQLYDLNGKVAIVTGAAEGMGKEVARFLAGAGASVAVADINAPWAEDTAREINAAGGKAKAYRFDVADEPSVVAMVAAVRRDLGRIDILVNVAGVQDRAYLEDSTLEYWDHVHHVNLRGPFLTIRETAKVMRADKTKGRIVNISSNSSLHPTLEGLVAYASSKAGLNGVTRNTAYELVGDGITVNAILPGNTTTAGQGRASGPPIDPAKLPRLMPPLGRTGRPADIASAVLFLVAPASEWITGQTLAVDGGMLNN
jgi:NAD(P)-dependent dehydrogenase (short-subunit alcohol dehydrogenase family)